MINWKNVVTTSPIDLEQGDGCALKVVAVIHQWPFWSAYRGPSDWSDERVAEQGDQLLREQAEPLFYPFRNNPDLVYRE